MEWGKYKELAKHVIVYINNPSIEYWPADEGGGYFYDDTPETEAAYNSALAMLTSEFENEMSQEAVKMWLDDLMGKLYDKYAGTNHVKTIATELQMQVEALHSTPEFDWKFFVVVEKAKISQEWDLGNVSVLPGTPQQLQQIKDLGLEFLSNINIADEKNERASDKFEDTFVNHFAPKPGDETVVLATTVRTKDHYLGREISTERFEEALNFLRFVSLPIDRLRHLWKLGLYGDIAKHNRGMIGIATGAGLTQRYASEIHGMDLDKVRIPEHDRFFTLFAIPPEKRSNLERQVMKTIHWIGQTIAAQDISHQYLFIFTALETLLLNQRGAHAKTLGERCAFLTATGLGVRKNILALIREGYDVRSDITHGTWSGQAPQGQLDIIIAKTYDCLEKVVDLVRRHNWQEQCQLIEYLDDLKLR